MNWELLASKFDIRAKAHRPTWVCGKGGWRKWLNISNFIVLLFRLTETFWTFVSNSTTVIYIGGRSGRGVSNAPPDHKPFSLAEIYFFWGLGLVFFFDNYRNAFFKSPKIDFRQQGFGEVWANGSWLNSRNSIENCAKFEQKFFKFPHFAKPKSVGRHIITTTKIDII